MLMECIGPSIIMGYRWHDNAQERARKNVCTWDSQTFGEFSRLPITGEQEIDEAATQKTRPMPLSVLLGGWAGNEKFTTPNHSLHSWNTCILTIKIDSQFFSLNLSNRKWLI